MCRRDEHFSRVLGHRMTRFLGAIYAHEFTLISFYRFRPRDNRNLITSPLIKHETCIFRGKKKICPKIATKCSLLHRNMNVHDDVVTTIIFLRWSAASYWICLKIILLGKKLYVKRGNVKERWIVKICPDISASCTILAMSTRTIGYTI